MKVNVKKALATMMAAALIVTSAQCPTASAAKKPTLNSKKVTLTVGKKKTLKVKNKIKGSTYTWKSSKVKVAKVTKKGVVKALKAGTATITCKVKTKATKKKKAKTYTLKCKVTVKKKKTTKPTPKPTAKPTTKPSAKPSDVPSDIPSSNPTLTPSDNPSTAPSNQPSTTPSDQPSVEPSVSPSADPSASPSVAPSASPSTAPSYNYRPSGGGSKPSTSAKPSESPSASPTSTPEGNIAKSEADLKTLAANATASNIKEITLEPTENNFTIANDSHYQYVKLTVNAPNASIINEAKFASIDIKAIKPKTWTEAGGNAVKNIIKILTASAHIIVNNDSAVESIEVAPETAPKENETVTITAEGNVKQVTITKAENSTVKPNVTIKADSKEKVENVNVTTIANVTITANDTATTTPDTAIPVTVNIAESADNADKLVLTSSVPVKIQAETAANTEIELKEGASGSTVTVENEAAGNSTVKVTNSSGSNVTVNDTSLATNKDMTITVQENPVIAIKAAITEKAILGENSSADSVTKNLTLSTDLSTYGCTVTGASISWAATYDPAENSAALNKETGAVNQLGTKTTVTLTLTITPDNSEADSTTKFTLIIPAKEESVTPTISLSNVSYTVANTTSGSSIEATSGTSITITANADVKQGQTTVTEGIKYKFVSSNDNTTIPTTGFAESATIVLGENAANKYLWVEVIVGTGDSATTAYFASTDKITLSGNESFSMKPVK